VSGHPEQGGRLQRVLGLNDATALVIGCIVGAGIFRVAAPVASHLAFPGLILLAWVLGGLLSFCGALCYAELGAAYPRAGGDYVYLTRAYGRAVGFLFGWTKVFIERTGTIAVLAFVCAEYLGGIVGYGALGVRLIATTVIVGLTVANAAGVRYGSRVQNVMTVIKVAALLAIIGVGWWGHGTVGVAQPWWPASWGGATWSSLGVALVFVLWTYGGWTESAYIAEEVQDPQRTVPRSILLGLAVTTGLYLIVNLVYLVAIPVAELPQHRLVAAEVMRRAVGSWGGTLTSWMVIASTFGALNGYILTSARILMAVGQDHPVFARLGAIHPRAATPVVALAVNAAIAVLLVWTGTLDAIMTYSTVAISLFYGMAGAAVPILRRRDPSTLRPYRMWGYPLVPWLFAAAMAAFVLDVAIRQPRESLWGLGLVLAGVPLYAWSQRRQDLHFR